MQQLTQQLRSGEMEVQELPTPTVPSKMVLVRNHYSLISAGTEGSTVRAARANFLAKARARPAQAKQALEVLRNQGPKQAYRAVMRRLDAYSPLGYSSAGEVIEVGTEVEGLAVGDLVACAGAGYANHAEIVSVPINLCVKLQHDADLRCAAYNTLGAIALQGVRQADLRLGETCTVIGLGLIGQLTCLLLRASGIRVIGVDVEATAVNTAAEHCADLALTRSASGITSQILDFTAGLGVDASIIAAGTSSLDPINFAGAIARKKGKVVVVGAVPTGFDRDPHYYQKELEVRMSCSCGPGRYELNYEEKGLDYPAAYVRWSEKRNMDAFQELVYRGRVDVKYLTTHEVPLEQAPQAYDMITKKSEAFLGIVIKYDTERSLRRAPIPVKSPGPVEKIGIAFIGAGNYAQASLLPNLPKNDAAVTCLGVMTNSGTTSKRVAERFGFEFCTGSDADIFENESVNTIFIATRHDAHAEYVLRGLRAEKHVFVEKPLSLTLATLETIKEVYCAHLEKSKPSLMVGFNRRFSPLAIELKRRLGGGPMSIIYRVNAGAVSDKHWTQDPDIGGGRIVGEAGNFIDFMSFICGATPATVYASAMRDATGLNDTVTIIIEYSDGSTGTVCYFANGSKRLPKEYVEIYQTGTTAIIKDFKEFVLLSEDKSERRKLRSQDKGQAAMLEAFLDSLKHGRAAPISFDELYSVSLATFAAQRSLTEKAPIRLCV